MPSATLSYVFCSKFVCFGPKQVKGMRHKFASLKNNLYVIGHGMIHFSFLRTYYLKPDHWNTLILVMW